MGKEKWVIDKIEETKLKIHERHTNLMHITVYGQK